MDGIEHPQMDAIRQLWAARNSNLPPFLLSTDPAFTSDQLHATHGKYSPNQGACAAAIRLGYLHDQSLAVALMDAMDLYGHQSVTAGGYGWEAYCCDPHSLIWLGAMAALLWQSKVQDLNSLHSRVIQYFADHCAGAAAFWTSGGIRVPCSRAKTGDGRPLAPTWTVDSQVFCAIMGIDARALKLLGLDAKPIFEMLAACADDFPAIHSVISTSRVRTHIAIRKWNLAGGGFVAALDHDEPANDRLSYLSVGADGAYATAGNTLNGFEGSAFKPSRNPDLIFGGLSAAAISGDNPTTSAPVSPAPGVVLVPLDAIAARIAALTLAPSDKPIQSVVVNSLRSPAAVSLIRTDFTALADEVAAFHIGEGQKQAAEWHSIVSDLRVLS